MPSSDDSPTDTGQELNAGQRGDTLDALDDAAGAQPTGYIVTLWCHRCGARTDVRIAHDQLALEEMPCLALCGAVANAVIHWPLGRIEPVVIFNEGSELNAHEPH